MSKNLVIVESPAKAKTIEKYLGKGYKVMSSMGHIRDLPKKGLNIDIEHNFAPTYEISPDKTKVVSGLKKAAKNADVWLASDEDREGEAIAWHLCLALGLSPEKTKRIVFHEITKPAIERAIETPRTVDINLVDAQQARRLLDRLVGYELSPVLWKKIRPGLSAGRVQSVAVRLIVEREREIKAFKPLLSYKVKATFDTSGQELKAELADKLTSHDTAHKFIEDCSNGTFSVEATTQKPGVRSPSAPFTTSTLQQEAARRLGLSVRQTMQLAQRLYEAGYITYMRTDSTTISGLAIKAAEDYISKNYGVPYHKTRQFKTKNKSAQEAHEAIRPTDFNKIKAGTDAQQAKLYQFIWQRTLASQMADATVVRTEVTIGISNRKEKLLAKGEVLQFDGFMKVYGGIKDDTLLPPVEQGDKLSLNLMTASEYYSRPPARYSEASLVRKLEELEIGRPSTYAPTISTVQARGYIEKVDPEGEERKLQTITLQKGKITKGQISEVTGADRGKLVPTAIAEVTTDFLVKNFPSIVDYDFTATVENDFDRIADGNEQWVKMLKTFYKEFHPLVKKSEKVPRNEVSQARKLGKDPASSKLIYARYGRYGPMLLKGDTEDEANKPQFAPLPANTTIDTVTLEQALEMFKLPRVVGNAKNDEEITSNIGRFGPYIKIGKTFVSIRPLDPLSITEAQARKLYEAKLKKDADKNINEFPSGIKVLNGPYGPYITNGKNNARIPKGIEPAKLSEDEAKKILESAPIRRGNRRKVN